MNDRKDLKVHKILEYINLIRNKWIQKYRTERNANISKIWEMKTIKLGN